MMNKIDKKIKEICKVFTYSPKVSVIMPVYNAQRYLHQALDTLLSQSENEIEVIAVDDGSTDKSLEILKRYEAKSDRLRVYTQKNQYAGVARNLGLKHARGEYVLFLDSDDFFEKDLIKDTYAAAKEHDADIVVYGANYYDNKSGKSWYGQWLLDKTYIPEKQPFSYKDCPDTLFQMSIECPWTKLFRRDFIKKNRLKFQDLYNANDVYFVMCAMALAEKIVTVEKPLVNYRIGLKTNLQSSTKRCFYEALRAVHDKLIEIGRFEDVRRSYVSCALGGCIKNLRVVTNREQKRVIFDKLKNEAFDSLEVYGYPKEYYHNQKNYEEMLLVKNSSFEEYLETITAKPCVSVVMPVYNSQEFLEQAMDSLLGQSLKEIEIIAVDDGSTDGSLEILKKYKKEDYRVSVYTQQNQYAGVARNLGLSKAKGEYVIFLDSDDFFEENLLKDTYNKGKRNSADIVLFTANIYNHETKKRWRSGGLRTEFLPEKESFCYKDCPDTLYQITSSPPWTKLYRREFVKENKLQYQPLFNANDVFFTFSALVKAERIVALDKALVNYRTGLKTNLQSSKKRCFYQAYSAWHDMLVETGRIDAVRRSYVNRALEGCLYNLGAANGEVKKEVYEKLKNEGFQALEIYGHDADYFYNRISYDTMMLVMEKSFEEYEKYLETQK